MLNTACAFTTLLSKNWAFFPSNYWTYLSKYAYQNMPIKISLFNFPDSSINYPNTNVGNIPSDKPKKKLSHTHEPMCQLWPQQHERTIVNDDQPSVQYTKPLMWHLPLIQWLQSFAQYSSVRKHTVIKSLIFYYFFRFNRINDNTVYPRMDCL